MVTALIAGLVCLTLLAVGAWGLMGTDAREVARYLLIAVMRLFN